MSASSTRPRVLSLYRNCLKAAKRIPDPEQREVYRIYVHDGFHGKRDVLPGSRQAAFAIQNAEEQLERMNYYHSVVEGKKQQAAKINDNMGPEEGDGGVDYKTLKEGARGTELAEAYSASSKTGERRQPKEVDTNAAEKQALVQQWLLDALPKLYKGDLTEYSDRLVSDGFDSLDMLENELLEEDLKFMKKAHKRALVKRKLDIGDDTDNK